MISYDNHDCVWLDMVITYDHRLWSGNIKDEYIIWLHMITDYD